MAATVRLAPTHSMAIIKALAMDAGSREAPATLKKTPPMTATPSAALTRPGYAPTSDAPVCTQEPRAATGTVDQAIARSVAGGALQAERTAGGR